MTKVEDAATSRPTMLDVAKLADVSVGTVSRVLNQHPAVRPLLRERVQAAMRELDFIPNHVAQSMRTSATKTIGMMVPNMAVSFFSQICAASEQVLYTEGYTMTIINTMEKLDRELSALSFFKNRRVDGLIATVSDENSPDLLKSLTAVGGPLVLVQRRLSDTINSVATDHAFTVSQSLDYLFALGHRHIGLVVGDRASLPGKERGEAFLEYYAKAGVPATSADIHYCGLSQEEAFRRTYEMMNAAEQPTAIMAGSYQMTGVLRALKALNVTVPAQVSLISIGETDITELYEPPLTAVRWDYSEIGRLAASLLLENLKAPRPPVQLTVPVELVLRRSCSAPRQGPLSRS